MGKGDKKTRRGKIILGSHGVRRPVRKKNAYIKAVETGNPKTIHEVKKEPVPSQTQAKTTKINEPVESKVVAEKKKTAAKKADKEPKAEKAKKVEKE